MNMAKTQTGTFEVKLKSDKLSVSLEIDPKTLYVVSKNAAISYSIIPVDTEVKITMINLIDAINNLIKNGEHADKKCKALAVFTVSEAARFSLLRSVLYWTTQGVEFSWNKILPLLRLWEKIREESGITEVTTPISVTNLEDYIKKQAAGTGGSQLQNYKNAESAFDYIQSIIEPMLSSPC